MSRPTPEQRTATDPDTSAWVAANAGSGKTHVLTQRVARLLLAGAEPQKILCLTYTRAAASEMQTRLFQTLGGWAMASDRALGDILAGLAGAGPEADRMMRARRLFARALETPGGLKIQTIHAFCEAVLRRFPLEAGVSPRFEVADEVQAAATTAAVREAMAEAAERGSDPAFDHAAGLLNEDAIADLTAAILARRGDIAATDLRPALDAVFGEAAAASREAIAADALNRLNLPARRVLTGALSAGGKTEQPLAEAMARAETKRATAPVGIVEDLFLRILTRKFEPRSTRGFPTKAVAELYPQAGTDLADLTEWALETRARLLAVEAAERARVLHLFGQPLAARYARAKAAGGTLDFDDLITRTRDLLARSSQREWVLYKLDQGIDHVLVDEAQDTAPAQWEVIRAIAEEFLAGQGARETNRTLFVVGDEKQSIYSFQGADAEAFGRMRGYFAGQLDHLGRALARPALETSFRSAPAVLDFVDRVFAGSAAHGLTVAPDAPIRHVAHRRGDAGRVDLWPLVPRVERPEPAPWYAPVDTPPADDAKARLAGLVAKHIAGMIGSAVLPGRADRPPRTVAAGHILVLVQRRDRLAQGIIRQLKTLGVPVAGADRLQLAREIAVQDLLALAKVAAMPGDDLSLAALLRSPLCAVSEDALFTLAHDRGDATLLDRVRESPVHAEVAAFLTDMIGQADFLRPYDFLERALIRHGGRRRLIARLGDEAEDAIDELLTQALIYEARHPPSLIGLVDWIETTDQQVKREMDQGADHVRVMTVHGAKGLEAPIVVLPDTTGRAGGGAGRQTLLRSTGDGNAPPLTLWAGPKDRDDPVTRAARERADEAAEHERRRLLYVALTRAEDWLILCGAEPRSGLEGSWYDLLAQGMARCDGVRAQPSPTGSGQLQRYQTGNGFPESGAPEDGERREPAEPLPTWLGPAPVEPPRARLAPSALHDHEPAAGAGLGREQALLRGSAVHALLERAAPDPARAAAGLAARFPELDSALIPGVLAEATAARALPGARAVFAPDALAEVALAIDPPHGGPRMIGRADRLVPRHGGWLVVEFKTDAVIPDTPPAAYLAQLGAYLTALEADQSGAEIALAILWTAAPRLESVDRGAALAAFFASRRGVRGQHAAAAN